MHGTFFSSSRLANIFHASYYYPYARAPPPHLVNRRVILGIDIGACITINPLISASLTGALLAVAAIIRAIGGPPAKPPTL